jgi:hypothetical protein
MKVELDPAEMLTLEGAPRDKRGLIVASLVLLSLTMIGGLARAAGCSIQPGQGADSATASAFSNEYAARGGQAVVGCAANTVHRWGGGRIQDFTGGSGGTGAIMLEDGAGAPLWIHGTIWSKFTAEGGATGYLGYPTSEEAAPRPSTVGKAGYACRGRIQNFRAPGGPSTGARILYGTSTLCPGSTKAFALKGAIFQTWVTLRDPRKITRGGGNNLLGYPVSDEFQSTNGGASGMRQNYEGGYIFWAFGATTAGIVYLASDRFYNPLSSYTRMSYLCDTAVSGSYHLAEDARPGNVANSESAIAGQPVYSVGFGVVREIWHFSDFGYVVVVEHPVPIVGTSSIAYVTTHYGHLRRSGLIASVVDGNGLVARPTVFVGLGDRLGLLGSRSENGGYYPHLHWGPSVGSPDGAWKYKGYGSASDLGNRYRPTGSTGFVSASPERYASTGKCPAGGSY